MRQFSQIPNTETSYYLSQSVALFIFRAIRGNTVPRTEEGFLFPAQKLHVELTTFVSDVQQRATLFYYDKFVFLKKEDEERRKKKAADIAVLVNFDPERATEAD